MISSTLMKLISFYTLGKKKKKSNLLVFFNLNLKNSLLHLYKQKKNLMESRKMKTKENMIAFEVSLLIPWWQTHLLKIFSEIIISVETDVIAFYQKEVN